MARTTVIIRMRGDSRSNPTKADIKSKSSIHSGSVFIPIQIFVQFMHRFIAGHGSITHFFPGFTNPAKDLAAR